MLIALRLIVLALVLLVASVFLWQNLTPMVAIVFLGTKLPELPLALWILMAFGIGAVISMVFGVLLHWARRSGPSKRKANGEPMDPWDDENWEKRDRSAKSSTRDDGFDRPLVQPQPPKKVVDAEFRVITPPLRNLDEDEV